MAELSDKAKALLAKQRTRYIESLGDKRRELAELNDDREGQWLELIDAVHRLAGSAGLHGLNQLQQLAVSAERALRDTAASPAQQSQAVERVLDQLALAATELDDN